MAATVQSPVTGQTVTVWSALGQLTITGIAAWGLGKVVNEKESWVPYRNQMIFSGVNTLINAFSQQAAQQVMGATPTNQQTA